MMHLIIHESRNTRSRVPPFRLKHDGDEFASEARKFGAYLHGLHPEDTIDYLDLGDASKLRKRQLAIQTIDACRHLKTLAFFGHGWPTGISAGFTLDTVPTLAHSISLACDDGATLDIRLYACLTGRSNYKGGPSKPINIDDGFRHPSRPNDGFAMYLSRELEERGVDAVLLAHLSAGHVTRNKDKVVIGTGPAMHQETMTHRARLCPLRSHAWKSRDWFRLIDDDPTFRFDLERMSAGGRP